LNRLDALSFSCYKTPELANECGDSAFQVSLSLAPQDDWSSGTAWLLEYSKDESKKGQRHSVTAWKGKYTFYGNKLVEDTLAHVVAN
jgi:hypothetical protein